MIDASRTLVDLYQRSVERFASRPLFGTKTPDGWQYVTYAEFGRMVDECRGGLAALGVGAGDRVAMVSNNRVEWAVTAYATYGLGGAFVPMYESQRPAEWRFILKDCGAKVVVAATPTIARALRDAKAELPELGNVVALEPTAADELSYAELLRRGAAAPVPATTPQPDDLAGFIYTSGTTGDPKGVMLSHGNFASNVAALCSVFPIEPDDRSLSFLPWAHVMGQTCEVHIMIDRGASTAINDELPHLIENLAEVRPTILIAVPRIFNRLYDAVTAQLEERPAFLRSLVSSAVRSAVRAHRGERLGVLESARLALVDRLVFSKVRERFGGRLRYAISGSAALDVEVAQFIDALGISFYEGYGLTETSPIVTANVPGARKIGSVGKPLPGVRVVIDEREELGAPPGEGEIIVYGPNVMRGYYHRPEEQAHALLPDGGFRTGDLGRLDDDGYLFITGRVKDQYKLENGKYVMPGPLEDRLTRSRYIANVMLHGANKPYSVALVAVDEPAIRSWATRQGIELRDVEENEQVQALIGAELELLAKSFRGYERPRGFVITAKQLTTESGALTPTLKLKRRVLLSEFGERLEALYQKASGFPVETAKLP